MTLKLFIASWCVVASAWAGTPEPVVVVAKGPIYLRSGAIREWRSFPETAVNRASLSFEGKANPGESSLWLKQADVKNRTWEVRLNGARLGVLREDERLLWLALAVPAGTLRNGKNELVIEGKPGLVSDDVMVGEIRLEPLAVTAMLGQARVDVEVRVDREAKPVRIGVTDVAGALMPFARAQRPGVLYTADGKAEIGLPPGRYRLYASRGFDYSAASVTVAVKRGDQLRRKLAITREVKIPGYVSCDTHVHTRELSGHGDATVAEQVLAAAGEGVDVIISTEHNQVADYTGAIQRAGLSRWLKTVAGNEITTNIGHFNIFPLQPGQRFPDPAQRDWGKLMSELERTAVVRIQNHPRDVHSGYLPFSPRHHLSSVGENLNGRPFTANAMEVVNSGAMSSDPMQLARDWMGLLTRGLAVAAIGSSDTHTVDFVPVAQARTLVEVRGDESKLAERLAEGRNLVSYGLAAELREVKVEKGRVTATVRVWGPSWTRGESVAIYSNGVEVWRRQIRTGRKGGLKFEARVRLDLPLQDTHLVAIATGPDVQKPYWAVRKPYQPVSDGWNPIILGVSAAERVDVNGDGQFTSPLALATELRRKQGEDLKALVQALGGYDRSVTQHVLNLLRAEGRLPSEALVKAAFLQGGLSVREGYAVFAREVADTAGPARSGETN